AVKNNEIDMAFILDYPDTPASIPANLNAEVIAQENHRLVVNSASDSFGEGPISLRDAADLAWVASGTNTEFGAALINACRRTGHGDGYGGEQPRCHLGRRARAARIPPKISAALPADGPLRSSRAPTAPRGGQAVRSSLCAGGEDSRTTVGLVTPHRPRRPLMSGRLSSVGSA